MENATAMLPKNFMAANCFIPPQGGLLELVATNGFFHILQHLTVVHSITQQYYLIEQLLLKPIV